MSAKPAWVEAVRLYQNSPSGRGNQAAPALPAAKTIASQPGLWVIGVLVLAAALLLGVIAVFTWQSLRELRELDSRIGVLDGVERRLGEKLDRGNGGLLKQFDRSHAAVEALHLELGQLRGPVDEAVQSLRDAELRMDEAAATLFQAPLLPGDYLASLRPPEAAKPSVGPVNVPVPGDRHMGETTGARFERRESPDGSVSYRLLD